ncbi:unnamed protein product, partial [Acidithrix sp. C25]
VWVRSARATGCTLSNLNFAQSFFLNEGDLFNSRVISMG